MPELVVIVGLPGAGKSTFYAARLASTHVQVSMDLMPNRRDRREHQLRLIDEALAAGRSVAVDNVNATIADRARLIGVARRHGAGVTGYVLETDVRACLERNRARTGRARVPAVAIWAAAKRLESPTPAEGFDRLHRVAAGGGRFVVSEDGAGTPPTIFLLSPASTSGERAVALMSERATFPLAVALRSGAEVPLGEVFSFLSSLYFRGKLTYAQAFARPPAGLCGAFVITPGEGLRDPAGPVTLARLREYAGIRVLLREPRYLEPLRRDAAALATLGGERCRIVLLGSVASDRYVEPLLEIFGTRLVFPAAFVGRGDMSRGGLLLRCVADRRELEYAPMPAPPATDRAPRACRRVVGIGRVRGRDAGPSRASGASSREAGFARVVDLGREPQELVGVPVVVGVGAVVDGDDVPGRIDQEVGGQAEDPVLGLLVEAAGGQDAAQPGPQDGGMQGGTQGGLDPEPAIELLRGVGDAVEGQLRLVLQHLLARRMEDGHLADTGGLELGRPPAEAVEMEVADGTPGEAAELEMHEPCAGVGHGDPGTADRGLGERGNPVAGRELRCRCGRHASAPCLARRPE
jgi:predicted kinase